ncbi:BLUF domain-containing protein [Acinetobacter nematophilus]|uniref:BLUF domain-containing protein n=1 Tax=Acinetobacter nematophilus TaxID=2994642 RepID=UPI003AF9FF87
MELVQLCYVSSINLKDLHLVAEFKQAMRRAMTFFSEQHIHGVSFYANEYFLHCFEGDAKSIDLIYQHILNHQDQHCRFCFLNTIDEFHFAAWQMKYVDRNGLVSIFCKKCGLNHFKPMSLTDQQIIELMQILSARTTVKQN